MNTKEIRSKILGLKMLSGTHSPSIDSILEKIPELKLEVDACFLSNPYATELFLDYLNKDLITTGKLRDVLEYYPPQNRNVASYISKFTGVDENKIFVGNGAIEIIQAIVQRFVSGSICIILPTFSSYYEFLNENVVPIFYNLKKEDKFLLDVKDYVKFVKDSKCSSIVLINPNNPNGGYINKDDLIYLLNELSYLENIILDESFIHFAYEDLDMENMSMSNVMDDYKNLVIVKSMSKDFGIAGIRCGYAIMKKTYVNALLDNGYLWNVSGLANYFFKLYSNAEFQRQYEVVRKKYIMNTMMLVSQLSELTHLKVYPSKANFVLIELPDSVSSFDYTIELLLGYNIYVRDCSDKLGLNGQFIRVASRSFEENLLIIDALKNCMINQNKNNE
jgi:histidinol-phosphate/aromatic aminotransferase/cobyric acid decarboxylase-like protein